jgi:hypothetical protein
MISFRRITGRGVGVAVAVGKAVALGVAVAGNSGFGDVDSVGNALGVYVEVAVGV